VSNYDYLMHESFLMLRILCIAKEFENGLVR